MNEAKPRWHNGREYLRQLINVAFISISIPLVLFAWLYLEFSADRVHPVFEETTNAVLIPLISIAFIVLLFLAHNKVRKDIAVARQLEGLISRLTAYRRALIKRYLLYALISLLVVVGFYITASELLVVCFAVMIIVYSVQNPDLHSISRQLRLKEREKEIMIKNKPLPIEK